MKILVVPTEKYLQFDKNTSSFANFLDQEGLYIERDLAEKDPTYLQPIPYCVVQDINNNIFVYKRLKKGNETRLHNNSSIGVGGHVDEITGYPSQDFTLNCIKELKEELKLVMEPIVSVTNYFIYDTSNDVGKVHLGVVTFVNLNSQAVEVNEPEKIEGEFIDKYLILSEGPDSNRNYENWSKIVIKEYLK